MEPEERSVAGIFMSFQTPVEIPGVSNIDFLNMAYNARRNKLGEPELGPIEVSISSGTVPYFPLLRLLSRIAMYIFTFNL